MADGSDVWKIQADHVRLVAILFKKYPWQFHKTQSTKLMEDLPMEKDQTPIIVIIYIYDNDSGKLTAIVNVYYI